MKVEVVDLDPAMAQTLVDANIRNRTFRENDGARPGGAVDPERFPVFKPSELASN